MDFSKFTGIKIPEGNVTKITSGGVVLWEANNIEYLFIDFE